MTGIVKRLRIIAGPNGSGKTSVYQDLLRKGVPVFGIFVNADEIEKELRTRSILSFQKYGITVSDKALKKIFEKSQRIKQTIVNSKQFDVKDNFLVVKNKDKIDSYFAGFLADFVRDEMLSNNVKKITIETVMSHPSKLEVMKKASDLGYRIYLYYITTEDSKINVERVKARTEKGGHGVPKDVIKKRYDRSLDNLFEAVQLSDRAFLIDNSGKSPNLIAEYDKKNNTLYFEEEKCPLWVETYVLSKNKD